MLSINSLDLCRWGSADETIHLQSVIASLYCPGLLQWRQLKAWPCWDSDSLILAAHLQGKAETSMKKEKSTPSTSQELTGAATTAGGEAVPLIT